MPNAQFFLENTRYWKTHFDQSHEIFAKSSTAVSATLYTSDADHALCMKVSAPTNGEGVEKVVSNLAPDSKHILDFAYKCVGSQSIHVNAYDQVNSATIYSGSVAATTWRNHYQPVTTPAACSTVMIKLYRNNANTGKAFYIDDVRLHGNALLIDPDGYPKRHPDVDFKHNTANGKVTVDRIGRHVNFSMQFPLMSDTAFKKLLDASKSDEALYFDDRNVPVMTAAGTVRTSTTYNYTGVTTGGTHNAYQTATTATPVTSGQMQATEFTNGKYGSVDGDDAAYATLAITGTGKYGYHKFAFSATQYASAGQVRKFAVTYKGLADDASSSDVDGVELYIWNGTNWALLDETRTSSKQTLTFTTNKPEIAQQYVDTGNNLIRLLAKTRASKKTDGSLTLKSQYIAVTVNDDLSRTISLMNKGIPSANAVVSVKNLTSGTALTAGAASDGYDIGDDRRSVVVTSDQSDGDVIEVKYNQFYEVTIASLSEPETFADSLTAPHRVVDLELQTLASAEE